MDGLKGILTSTHWFSRHPDAELEQLALIHVLEHSGYSKKLLKTINTVELLRQTIYNASIKAYNDKLTFTRHAKFNATSATMFAKKMIGNIGEYLLDGVVNSQQHGKLLPYNWCYSVHRTEHLIDDMETGSPDRIIYGLDGKPYALIQCKFLSPSSSLTVNDNQLSNTFMWYVNEKNKYESLKQVNKIGLFTNKTYKKINDDFKGGTISFPHLHEHIDVNNDGQTANQIFWNNFWNELYKNIKYFAQKHKKCRTPDSFQKRRLIEPIMKHKGPAIISGPCGVGKMVCQAYILPTTRSINLIMSGVRLVLASQTYGSLKNDIASNFHSLFVMSRSDFQHENSGIDEMSIHCKSSMELAREIFYYTINDNDIKPLNIFVLEQSLTKIVDALIILQNGELVDTNNKLYDWCNDDIDRKMWWNKIVFLLTDAIYDEAHNLVTGETRNTLDDENKRKTRYYTDLPWLNDIFTRSTYWTATIRLNGTKRDMSNTYMFGEVKAMILPSEAIKLGYVVPPFLIPMAITRDDINEYSIASSLDTSLDIAYYIKCIENAIHNCTKDGLDTKLMLFVANARDQEEYKRIIEEYFNDNNLKAFVVRSTTPYKERDKIFKEYQDAKCAILINYAIVHEGVDIAGVTGVILGRDMDDVMLVQAIGRVMRLLFNDRLEYGPSSLNPNKELYKKKRGYVYYMINHAYSSNETAFDDLKYLMWKLRKLTNDKDWFVMTWGNLDRTIGSSEDDISNSQPNIIDNNVIMDEELKNKIYIEQDAVLDSFQQQQNEDDERREIINNMYNIITAELM